MSILALQSRELVALFKLSSSCLMAVSFMWLFLTVPWVGLQSVNKGTVMHETCVVLNFIDS